MSENTETTEDVQEETKKEESAAEPVHTEKVPATEKGDRGDATKGSEEQVPPKVDKHKIDILLKATGNAPIMKQKKWVVDQEKRIGSVIEFIKKYLRLEPSENLFLYVNQAFAPSPDQTIKNLYECFGSDGRLVLHYCKSQAWG